MLVIIFENGKQIYQGPSGTKYEYDLSNPIDVQRYSIDIDAQMRDKLSTNLYRELEGGGGILE